MYAVKPTQQTNTHTLFLIHEAYSNCANRHKTHIQISTKSTENTAARLGVAHFVHSWSTMRPFVLNLNALHLNGCLCKICVIKTIVFFFEIDKNILETYKHWCLFLFVCFHRLFDFLLSRFSFEIGVRCHSTFFIKYFMVHGKPGPGKIGFCMALSTNIPINKANDTTNVRWRH